MRRRSRVVARGARLPSELTHRTRLRRARRRMTCFFESGSPDQSLAKQTMSRPSRCGMERLPEDGPGRELRVPELEDQQRPQLVGEVGAALVAVEERAHLVELEA